MAADAKRPGPAIQAPQAIHDCQARRYFYVLKVDGACGQLTILSHSARQSHNPENPGLNRSAAISGCCDCAERDRGCAQHDRWGAAWRRGFHSVIPRASRGIQQTWG